MRERTTLAKIMKESSSSTSEPQDEPKKDNTEPKHDIQNKGVWSPKLHFAWSIVLQNLYQRDPEVSDTTTKDKGKKDAQLSFCDFWNEVVNNGLFANAASDERKYWGFLLVMKLLNEASVTFAGLIFTPNVTRCLRNQLASDERYLHRIALKVSKAVQLRAARDQQIIVPAVTGLMSGSDGSLVNFDQVTKTKIVEKLLSFASTPALGDLLPLFEKMIMKPGTEDGRQAATTRLFVSNLLAAIVKAQTNPSSPAPASASACSASSDELASLFERVASTFSRFGFFNNISSSTTDGDSSVTPPISPQTQEIFRNKIVSCLNMIIAGRQNLAHTVPFNVVKKIHDKYEKKSWGNFHIEMDATSEEAIDSAFKILKKIVHKVITICPSPSA